MHLLAESPLLKQFALKPKTFAQFVLWNCTGAPISKGNESCYSRSWIPNRFCPAQFSVLAAPNTHNLTNLLSMQLFLSWKGCVNTEMCHARGTSALVLDKNAEVWKWEAQAIAQLKLKLKELNVKDCNGTDGNAEPSHIHQIYLRVCIICIVQEYPEFLKILQTPYLLRNDSI